MQGAPLVTGMTDVTAFERETLITALRTDQAGESTFSEFLAASWRAGVVRYDVDFTARTVAYYRCNGEQYVESYPPAASARKRWVSSSRPPDARRAFPCTADSVVENTTFGSLLQIAANSSVE